VITLLYLAKESEEQIEISERWENGGMIFSVEPSGSKRA
jgi:hypothetical protein